MNESILRLPAMFRAFRSGIGLALWLCLTSAAPGSDLSSTAKADGAYLGVAVQPVGPTLERQLGLPPALGLLVERVAGDSPADRAGIRPHDILLQLNSQLLFVPEQLEALLRSLSRESPIPLELIRARERLNLELTPVARRSAPSGPSLLRVTVVGTSIDVTASALADFIEATAQTEPRGVAEDPPLNAYLGLRLAVLPPAVMAHLQPGYAAGAVILEVAPGSPAESASLQPHDVIVQVDRQPILHPNDLFALMRARRPQSQLQISVLRQNRTFDLPVRLAAPPVDSSSRFDRTIDLEGYSLPPLDFATDAEWLIVFKPLPAGSPPVPSSPTSTELPTLVVEDSDLTVRIEGDALHREAIITDSRGSLIFRGRIATPADRLRMPPNIWARVAALIDPSNLSPRPVPQLESDQLREWRSTPDWL